MANSLALYVTSKSKRATEGVIQNVSRRLGDHGRRLLGAHAHARAFTSGSTQPCNVQHKGQAVRRVCCTGVRM